MKRAPQHCGWEILARHCQHSIWCRQSRGLACRRTEYASEPSSSASAMSSEVRAPSISCLLANKSSDAPASFCWCVGPERFTHVIGLLTSCCKILNNSSLQSFSRRRSALSTTQMTPSVYTYDQASLEVRSIDCSPAQNNFASKIGLWSDHRHPKRLVDS